VLALGGHINRGETKACDASARKKGRKFLDAVERLPSIDPSSRSKRLIPTFGAGAAVRIGNGCLPASPLVLPQNQNSQIVYDSERSRRIMDGPDMFVHNPLVRLLNAGYTA
jgi:hypothetical protein